MEPLSSLTRGTWAENRIALPLFTDARLVERAVLHQPGCKGSLQENGEPSGPCTCHSAHAILPERSKVQIVDLSEEAALVDFPPHGILWIESAGLSPIPTPRVIPCRSPSPFPVSRCLDWELLQEKHPVAPPTYPRRRREPVGGEIVYLRNDLHQGAALPWRFYGTTQTEKGTEVLLIDPSLDPTRALGPSWVQVKRFLIEKSPASYLIPVFPLPDGTRNPGWVARK